jgi:conjugative relaxase-like TrwC/TraI family protein
MLWPTPIKTPKGKTVQQAAGDVVDYLKNEKETLDQKTGYYSKGQAPSMWLGEGAKALGLEGAVADKDLYELLQGHMPDGTDLSKRGGRAAQARLATDITLSASKSYSMMATADPALAALWDESVKYTAALIEKEIVCARRGHGGTEVEHTGKAVMAAYTHEETRMVDGTADVDRHTHLIALNMTERADGQWVRMDLSWGEKMVLAKLADFAQKAYLAKRVQEMGYAIRPTEDGWEFAAISRDDIEDNSRRTAQRNDWLKAHGIDPELATSAQKTQASLATRGDKAQMGRIDQQYEWRARLRDQGLDLDAIVREAAERGPIAAADLSLEAVRSAARHVGERESVFSKDNTRLEALKAGMGSVILETVDTAMTDKSAGLLDVGGGKITTRETLYREQEILARIRAGRDTLAPLVTNEQVSKLIETTEQASGHNLSEGQKAAIRLALTTTDRVVGVIGAWGVGKTTGAARPIVAQAQALGLQVQAIAPTTQAKREIAGARADETMTIAAWLQTKPELTTTGAIVRNENRLVVMDEAGMVDAATMDAVLNKLDAEGGRLIKTGDPERQLRSVGAGKPLQQAMETGAIRYVEINEVQRQLEPRLKAMAQVWANRDTVAAVQIAKEYMHTVTVTEADWKAAGRDPAKPAPTQEKAGAKPTDGMIEYAQGLGMKDAATSDFQTVRAYLDEHSKSRLGFEDKTPEAPAQKIPRDVRQQAIIRETAGRYLSKTPEQRADLVMMAATNKLRKDINAAVREGLRAEGALGEREAKLTALDKVDMTAEQLARPESYAGRTDLIVRMLQGKGKDRQIVDFRVRELVGERVILDGPDGKDKIWNPATAKNPQVYTTREIALAVGDEVNFRDSSGLRDTPDRVENGEDGRIVRLDPEGPVALMEDGREVTLRNDQNHPLDYGYCRTVHKAQGMSKGGAIYAAESVGVEAISQIAGVACTRAKRSLEIVTDDPEKLGGAMEKWAEHQSAMEAAKAAHQPDLATLQKLRAEAQADLGKTGDLSRAREAAEAAQEQEQQAREREQQAAREREAELER